MSENLILMPFQDLPFNGDIFIMKRFADLKEQYNLNTAIETGSCLFSTTKYLSELFDKVYTCEINETYYNAGVHKIDLAKVTALRKDSVEALKEIIPALPEDARCIFFLDAHWGDHCPLLEELAEIAKMKTKQPPIICIHDFQVPGHPELGFDAYKEKAFNVEFTATSIYAIENALGVEYKTMYNSEAAGAMRGIVYFVPLLKLQDILPELPEAPVDLSGLQGEEIAEPGLLGTTSDPASDLIEMEAHNTGAGTTVSGSYGRGIMHDLNTGEKTYIDSGLPVAPHNTGASDYGITFIATAVPKPVSDNDLLRQQAAGRIWRSGVNAFDVKEVNLNIPREIEFNALFTAGANNEIKAMIPNVVFVNSKILGKSVKAFNHAIEHTGYFFNGTDAFEPLTNGTATEPIPVDEYFVTDNTGNVYFSAKPLQYTGFEDSNGVKLFDNDSITGTYGDGFIFWAETGQWVVKWVTYENLFTTLATEFTCTKKTSL